MENNINNKRRIKYAVVGCLHGKFEDIYIDIAINEKETGEKVEFVLCCGDFQVII
jgi:lariat debranching enzyme